MRQVEFADEPVEGSRLLQRVQILALDILDQRHGDCRVVRNLPYNGGNRVEPGHLRRAPAAFARHDLVALGVAGLADGPRDDRLHDALRLDGAGQLLERVLAYIQPRLVPAALQQVEWNFLERTVFPPPGDGRGFRDRLG